MTKTPPDPFVHFANATIRHVENVSCLRKVPVEGDPPVLFPDRALEQSRATISQWPGYSPTPVINLEGLARATNVALVLYKDEGKRFGLGSFKALGGAYAVSQLLSHTSLDAATITVTSATDGNHGLSVAWGAKKHGCRCVIFIHAEVSPGREQALKSQGAEVIRVDGNYDDSVHICYAAAKKNSWHVISDTSGDSAGSEVARTVMSGYSVMVAEIIGQLAEIPTHVFIQGGVGGLAATVCEIFRLNWGAGRPRFIVVEPQLAPCLYESAKAGDRTSVAVTQETVMAGLSCGEVSYVAWPTLMHFVDDFLTIPDLVVAPTMRLLGDSPYGDPSILAGESAVAGLAGFICARQQADVGDALCLDDSSRILVIGTEGATDAALYQSLTGLSATP